MAQVFFTIYTFQNCPRLTFQKITIGINATIRNLFWRYLVNPDLPDPEREIPDYGAKQRMKLGLPPKIVRKVKRPD